MMNIHQLRMSRLRIHIGIAMNSSGFIVSSMDNRL